jgi:hypothetical protein
MARREVVEVVCDRCNRKENQNVSELPSSAGPELTVTFLGETAQFSDLCKRCRAAVRGYYCRILRKVEDTTEIEAITSGEAAPDEVKKKHGFLGLG